MSELDIQLRPDSSLGKALAALEDFRAKVLDGYTFTFRGPDEKFAYFMDGIATDAMTKALHWGYTTGFRMPRERWKHLCKGDPLIFRRGHSSKARNQVWESIIASLVATFAEDVEFAEPDVTCRYQGKRFSVAAKVCYSRQNVSENVLKGFSQFGDEADAGLVFLDVAGIYPQLDEYALSASRKYHQHSNALEIYRSAMDRWCRNFPFEDWINECRRLCRIPVGVAFFLPLLIQVEKYPVPALITHMPIRWGDNGTDFQFATSFVQACDSLLGFSGGNLADGEDKRER